MGEIEEEGEMEERADSEDGFEVKEKAIMKMGLVEYM